MKTWSRTKLSQLVYEKHNRIVSDGTEESFLKSAAKEDNSSSENEDRKIENDEFLIFGSSNQWKKLAGVVVLMCDGTFRCASLEFGQLLIISDVRQTPAGKEFLVPIFYVRI